MARTFRPWLKYQAKFPSSKKENYKYFIKLGLFIVLVHCEFNKYIQDTIRIKLTRVKYF